MPKEQLKGIKGWLSFFIFVLVVSQILNLIGGFNDLSSAISTSLISIVILDVLYWIAFIGLGIYTIYSLAKIKKNAVSLAKMYTSLVFLTNLMGVIFSFITNSPLASETSYLNGSTIIIQSLIFGVVWFLYLTYSKRVRNTYPIKERRVYILDKIWFFFILAVPLIIFLLAYIGIAQQSPNITNSSYSNQIGIAPISSSSISKYYVNQTAIPDYSNNCPVNYVLGQDNQCHIACGDNNHYCATGICDNNQCVICPSNYVPGDNGTCYPSCINSNTYCSTGRCYNNQCVICPAGDYLATDGKCYPNQ